MFTPRNELAALDRRLRRIERLLELVAERLEIDPEELGGATGPVSAEVAALAAAGKKIQAIKLLREERDLGLAEAKRIVDAL